MDILIVPVPLFNVNVAVEAYYFRIQKGNNIIEQSKPTSVLDGAMHSPALEALKSVGLEAFTMGKPIFVPINNFMLIAKLEDQCTAPVEKVIFVLDSSVYTSEEYIEAIKRLKNIGYRFAIQKISHAEPYDKVLKLCDYIFLDYRVFDTAEQLRLRFDIAKNYRHLKIVLTHVNTMEAFETMKLKFKGVYEGRFYRIPVTKGEYSVSPLQTNLIELLNTVRGKSFEFDEVTEIVQHDTALTISLLKLVNSPYIGVRQEVKSIGQAVALLGQEEVEKWVTTAVTKLLGAEKPSEITKLSLVRAKFAEALAPYFGLQKESDSLFLMGLFSLLDAILEMPMKEALEQVHVSKDIIDALLNLKGKYYPVYEFMQQYESANWKAVSRTLIIKGLSAKDIYGAYINTLCWYKELLD